MTFNKEVQIFGLPVLKDNIIWLWVENGSVVVIDPAVSEPVINWIKSKNLKLDTIFQTHHHSDHIGGTRGLVDFWPDVKVVASKKEINRIPLQNVSVEDGDCLNILGKEVQILEIVGHTKTHISFFLENYRDPILFVGDTIFSAGCGRVFEGTYAQMYRSLKKIMKLPLNTMIYCAHEYTQSNLLWALNIVPEDKHIQNKLIEVKKKIIENKLTIPTTLKEEMKINLFLRAKNLKEFCYLRAHKDSWV